MRKSIDTYVQGIAHDNSESIINGYDSIADYIISNAENGTVYEDRVNLRRDSADYRIMREKGMSDSDIKQYYKNLNNNINNNNQDIERKEEE